MKMMLKLGVVQHVEVHLNTSCSVITTALNFETIPEYRIPTMARFIKFLVSVLTERMSLHVSSAIPN